VRKRSAERPSAYSKIQEEREVLGEVDAAARTLRKEATPAAQRDVSPVPEMILKTQNPSQAASRIATLVEDIDGKVLETRGEHEFIVAIPASSYPRFLTALRELGDPMHPPAELPSRPTPQGTVTISIRLVP
jgi:hypothetical protein